MAKYRIVECNNGESTWYEVQNKSWFAWSTECDIEYVSIFFLEIATARKFPSVDDARSYINEKQPAPESPTLPITKRVCETIEV